MPETLAARRQRGSIVVYLVVGLAAFGVLAMAGASRFSSVISSVLSPNCATSARYMAESGQRYAMARRRAGADEACAPAAVSAMNGQTVTVDALGRLGEIVAVRPGYGRNYLLPQGLASLATPGNLKVFEQERRKLQAMNDAIKAEASALASRIEAAKVVIEVRTGDGDKLYGSVTSPQIAAILAEQGVDVDRRKLQLDEGIRTLGEYIVEVKLHPEVVAKLTVNVVKFGRTEQVTEPELQADATEEAAAE